MVWLVAAIATLFVFDAGIEALIVVQVVTWILTAVLHYYVLTRLVSPRRAARLSKARSRQIRASAIALTASSTRPGRLQALRGLILGYFTTPADVAFYSIAYSMSEALQQVVPMALAFAMMPNISRAIAARDFSFARRAYEGQLRLTAVVALPVAVTGAVLSTQVIDVFYGSDFDQAAWPLSVLLFTAAISSMGNSALWILVSSDRERVVVWLTAAAAAVSVSLE